MRNVNVLVVGLREPNDPGEEARLAAVLETFGTEHIIAVSPTPVTTAQTFGCRAVAPSLPAVGAAVRDAAGVIVAGGTVFGHSPRQQATTWTTRLGGLAAMARLASVRGIPFALLGVGAGDLRGPRERRLARYLVKCADLMILRDVESAAILAAAGASTPFRVGADPAWSLVTAPRLRPVGGEAVLVLVSHVAPRGVTTQLTEALRPVTASGCPVHLQPWENTSVRSSEHLAHEIGDRLDGDVRVVAPTASLQDSVARMARYRLVVAPRVGAVLAAAAAGVAVVAVAHEPGVAALAQRLGQRSIPGHASAGVLTRAMMLGVEQPPVEPDRIVTEIRRAQEGHQLVQLLLDQSGPHALGDFSGLVLTNGDAP